MKLALIVAVASNNVIGRDNQLPWHLPQDLKYFKTMTLGKPVIMGRKTYESIGKPLPGRTNIVVTQQANWRAEGVLVAHDVMKALAIAELEVREGQGPLGEAMVIGGAEIYRNSLEHADRVYLTRINREFPGDAYFPELSAAEWLKVSAIDGAPDAAIPHSFLVFERIN